MYDLVYFGYEPESPLSEAEFISEIQEAFPTVVLKDAYDYIKGNRREVELPEERRGDYYAWLVAFKWLEFSLTGQLLMMSKDLSDREKLKSYIDLSKEQYPQKFK